MGATSAVTLAVTVHQPGEGLVPLVERHLAALASRYTAMVAFCSQETHPAVLGLLRGTCSAVWTDDGPSLGIDRIGEVRRRSIQAGLEAGTSHLQMSDFDRAIHWSACHPQELDDVIAHIPDYDLLVLGRTARAWATHPPYQAETEPLFNRVFALVTGLSWDIGAGSRGLSRGAAETLLALSQEATVGVDAEWPLLLWRQSNFRLGYRACEGLEFETADRFAPEIEAAGGYRAWEAHMNADPGRWVFRLRLALMIAETILRYGIGREGTPASNLPALSLPSDARGTA